MPTTVFMVFCRSDERRRFGRSPSQSFACRGGEPSGSIGRGGGVVRYRWGGWAGQPPRSKHWLPCAVFVFGDGGGMPVGEGLHRTICCTRSQHTLIKHPCVGTAAGTRCKHEHVFLFSHPMRTRSLVTAGQRCRFVAELSGRWLRTEPSQGKCTSRCVRLRWHGGGSRSPTIWFQLDRGRPSGAQCVVEYQFRPGLRTLDRVRHFRFDVGRIPGVGPRHIGTIRLPLVIPRRWPRRAQRSVI